jgi:preprotein translocase subunit SecG
MSGLPKRDENLAAGQAILKAFVVYCRMTLASVAGVLFVVGLLNGRLFYLKVDSFVGVKLVVIAPLLLVGIFYGLGLAELPLTATWAERLERLRASMRSVMSQKLLLGQVVVGIVALAVLVLIVARSGNDPGVAVSATELKMRALLDKYLLVRPRTKEFLLGHPALLLALIFSVTGRYQRWVLPLLAIGAIGQSSIMDTFCHLHTPLFLSALRAGIGWALGAVFAIIIFLLLQRFDKGGASSAPANKLATNDT